MPFQSSPIHLRPGLQMNPDHVPRSTNVDIRNLIKPCHDPFREQEPNCKLPISTPACASSPRSSSAPAFDLTHHENLKRFLNSHHVGCFKCLRALHPTHTTSPARNRRSPTLPFCLARPPSIPDREMTHVTRKPRSGICPSDPVREILESSWSPPRFASLTRSVDINRQADPRGFTHKLSKSDSAH